MTKHLETPEAAPRRPRRWSLEAGIWLAFKVVVGIAWPVAMFLNTPARTAEAVGAGSLNVWLVGTFVGGFVSVVGIIMSTSPKTRRALLGYNTELAGLALIAGGALQYFFLQLGFLLDIDQWTNRIALAVFALGMVLAVLARAVQVVKLRRARASVLILGGP